MKFQLAINTERLTPDLDMTDVERHTLEMVQMADEGGFAIARAAEHHALEMTIAPNPFQILTWWAAHTSRIRLGGGGGGVLAPHQGAGEAALLDLYSGGRLEFGIGSGAYQREFDRLHPGLKRTEGHRYMREMLSAVKALWQGDYEHRGEYWSFPAATSVPKPLQKPHPPI
jgi:alkanesulfonate monooxygenase SsuD/methylene tetrahydromethanopterin reductase-like flavin-dependent oxidoreductase (luciferase family)